MKHVQQSAPLAQAPVSALDELARHGAQRLLAAALELEVEEYIQRLSDCRDAQGWALVVRNGYAPPRHVTVGSGSLRVQQPRVNDKRVVEGQRQRFTSLRIPAPRLPPRKAALLFILRTGISGHALPLEPSCGSQHNRLSPLERLAGSGRPPAPAAALHRRAGCPRDTARSRATHGSLAGSG